MKCQKSPKKDYAQLHEYALLLGKLSLSFSSAVHPKNP